MENLRVNLLCSTEERKRFLIPAIRGGGGSKKWGFEKSGLHCNYILIFFSRVLWNMSVKTSLVLHQIRYKIGLKKLTRATFSSSRSDSEVKPNPFVTHSHSFWNVLHQQQVVACSFYLVSLYYQRSFEMAKAIPFVLALRQSIEIALPSNYLVFIF